MDKKILVVGAGGIGSWLAHALFVLDKSNQLQDIRIDFADDDTVDTKNLAYQNFEPDDILEPKVDSIEARYGFGAIQKRIEDPKFLDSYDCVVSAVDNTSFRKMLFTWGEFNNKKFWIDLRSEGRSIAAFTSSKQNTLDKMLESMPEDVEEGSCQREYELAAGIIQNGNKIVAEIGAQLILNWLRKSNSPSKYIATF